jgi:hydrogenase expression/formation protein
MVDLEFLARKGLQLGRKAALDKLVSEYQFAKGYDKTKASKFAKAVLKEVKLSQTDPKDKFVDSVIRTKMSRVSAGQFGVGSRGSGDFVVHSLIAQIVHSSNLKSNVKIFLEPVDHDDAGAVLVGSNTVILGTIDGAHSRLSSFPFLMGFHDARAALRDLCVKGATPLFLMDDVHLADDGDVSKIFEFVAGVAALSELTGVPVVSGSTLRVGGDMVLGDRLVGAVCAVGILSDGFLMKKNTIEAGDSVIMTEGAGGGTISTTAIYFGYPDVVKETLNIDFYIATRTLRELKLLPSLHAMTDVTNGGVRGDLEAMARLSSSKIIVDEHVLYSMINPRVLRMLKKLRIDPLGLSLDSLLIFAAEHDSSRVVENLKKVGIRAGVIGRVEQGSGCYLNTGETIKPLKPKFRESAYTGLKKLVGEEAPQSYEQLSAFLKKAASEAKRKKDVTVNHIKHRYRGLHRS